MTPGRSLPGLTAGLIQCVPNFSEGRDETVLGRLLATVSQAPGVAVADFSADSDHHRAVLTMLGRPADLEAPLMRLAAAAVELIDLNNHLGVHPRLGALDVLPFIPWGATEMGVCVEFAHRMGARLAGELELPVFFYEAAALSDARTNLAEVRRGGFEELQRRSESGDLAPDVGPPRVHPTAGAVAVGARGPLTAFNVKLGSSNLTTARQIAAALRGRRKELPGIKTLGLQLPGSHSTQISMNLTEPARTPLWRVVECVREEAARHGLDVGSSELVGTVRLEELLEVVRHSLDLPGLHAGQVLDLWAASCVGDPPEALGRDGQVDADA